MSDSRVLITLLPSGSGGKFSGHVAVMKVTPWMWVTLFVTAVGEVALM